MVSYCIFFFYSTRMFSNMKFCDKDVSQTVNSSVVLESARPVLCQYENVPFKFNMRDFSRHVKENV